MAKGAGPIGSCCFDSVGQWKNSNSARLPAPCGQVMIGNAQPGRDGCGMRPKVTIALLLGLAALGTAACDKCGNFLGQPAGELCSCK